MVLMSFSKTFAWTGFRAGYIIAGPELMKVINGVPIGKTSKPVPFQKAGTVALKEGWGFVEEMRVEFKKRVDYFVPRLNEIEGITCPMPEGAFYTFADVSEMNVPSRDFAREFYHHEKVRCAPGVQYGPNSEGHISARCITQEKIGAYRARPSLAVTLLPMERFSYQRLKSGSSSNRCSQRALTFPALSLHLPSSESPNRRGRLSRLDPVVWARPCYVNRFRPSG